MENFVLFICEVDDMISLTKDLKEHNIQFLVTEDREEIDAILKKKKPAVILVKDKPNVKREELVEEIVLKGECDYIVVFSDNPSVDRAKRYLDLGAWDYWISPLLFSKINVFLAKGENAGVKDKDYHELEKKYDHHVNIVGEHKKIKFALALAKKVAPSDATVLISGESGTGKELIAKYIHINSKRAHGPFVAVNCAALPENLLESELFGYEKGAFTGAYKSKPGKFELAQGGTLLLDEVSEINIALQAKLLRAIQEKEIDRLGGTSSIKVDVRIIATTNRNLKEYVEQGNFRQDLYFRLNVIPINLPPLRERGDDVILLAEYFLNKFSAKYGINSIGFSGEAISWMKEYSWPGNIRELENLVERAVLIAQGGKIEVKHFLLEGMEFDMECVEETDESSMDNKKGSSQGEGLLDINLDEIVPLDKLETHMIIKSLEKTKGNRTKAAELLGISVRTLRNKLAKLREEGLDL